MSDIFATLASIAARRRADPLSPLTVIVPTHAAGLHLRRRLAALGPFAAVRFETLPRIAELLAAGHLAAAGRSPLARPIGDYLTRCVAAESRGRLAPLAPLSGYARTLRQIFLRLRRGGIRASSEVKGAPYGGHFAEVLRLYDLFREQTGRFYDREDLLDAAADAVRHRRAGALQDLGEVYVVPPFAQTAAEAALLAALRRASPRYEELREPDAVPEMRFVLAPDPAGDAREAVREVIDALERGVEMHELAVFHGADHSYRRLLREAFAAADIPAAPIPGIPLIETPEGRGVLALAWLPDHGFARTAVMDMLSVAPLREWLSGRSGPVRAMVAAWDRISRDAGITRGRDVWSSRLRAFAADSDAASADYARDGYDFRAEAAAAVRDQALALLDVVEILAERLAPLHQQPAGRFISAFKQIVRDYFDPAAEALPEVIAEVDQLGAVVEVGGEFSLASFAEALAANLDAATLRPGRMGEAVAVADYRAAAGMRFRHVVLCGAYEGALPARPGTGALLDERVWERLRLHHPLIEDVTLRMTRAEEAARRVIAAAGDGTLAWSAPLYESAGTREFYPSPLMVRAASERAGTPVSASELREGKHAGAWFRRGGSPVACALRGPAVDAGELDVRRAVALVRRGQQAGPEHARSRALAMARARRSAAFTEWDGNLAALSGSRYLRLPDPASPTSLEHYAVCGFRYLCRSLLRLSVMEEPEEREMLDAGARGDLVHRVLYRFFEAARAQGRPGAGEAWGEADAALLQQIAEEELAGAAERGLTGLDVFSAHEARTISADLSLFLQEDTAFRRSTGAVPWQFEWSTPETVAAGVRLRGFVDRVDRTPDGRRAWVIDYKTGSSRDFKLTQDNPLSGGRKLQLPAYLAAVPDVPEVHALYWFITKRGGFDTVEYPDPEENRRRFERTVAAIAAGVREGAFPAVSKQEDELYGQFENCRYCDFDRICSRRREYEHAVKREDPAMAPWLAVSAAASGEAEE